MLVSLNVRDFAIARQVELGLHAGMSVVTGETGAGKSLLVDALLLLTGARADVGVVRHGAERAELVAEFALDDAGAALHWLQEQDLDEDGQCQLRRVIRADGGSRAFINGRPVTLGQLAALGETLVEIHGQHEHQALLSRRHQLGLLDACGTHEAELAEVQRLAREWAAKRRELAELDAGGDTASRIEWLQHELGELQSEALQPDEIEALLAGHRRQANAATLIEGFERSLAQLGGDEGFAIASALRQVRADLSRLQAHEPQLAGIDALLDSAGIQLDEALAALERLRDGLDLDPAQLDGLEQRLSRLHELSRKHRVPLDQLAARRDALLAELDRLQNADQLAETLRNALAIAARHWAVAADALGTRRVAAAMALASAVTGLMDELGMGGGRFSVAIERDPAIEPDPTGRERVEFMVSANPGQPLRPLRKVASGGELSRISLAIEVAALGHDSTPTMIFDEVDSGIGGAVAEVVGQKLRALGETRQVLCVTHLAQVAAQAHHHYLVSKRVTDGHSESSIVALDAAARLEEVARMLGGVEITAATRNHARQMLRQAREPA
jgi:DNA repair protein RecN (Recombination protein N)